MNSNIELLRERIRAGASWLDEREEGWRDRVTVNDLNLANTCTCVLGQVFSPAVKTAFETDRAQLPWWVIDDIMVRDEELVAGNYFPGYSYKVRDGVDDETGDWISDEDAISFKIGDAEFVTTHGAHEMAFDGPGFLEEAAYSWDDMTREWRGFLNGEWT